MNEIVERNFVSQLKFLEEMVNIDSGSTNVVGVDAVSNMVEKELADLGFKVSTQFYKKAGNCLVADFCEDVEDKIVLIGHMDTVFADGTAKKRPFKTEGDKAYGPGVLDMKGGISQIVFALKTLKEQGVPLNKIAVLLVGDEEVGHINSNVVDVIESLAKKTAVAFCCESGRIDGKVVTGRKGIAGVALKSHGKSAHAGNAYKDGVNAIVELAHKIISVQAFTTPDLSLTLSVGNVTGGGAINVVPDFAQANFDIRIQDFNKYKEFENFLKELCSKPDVPGAKTEYDLWLEYPSMTHSEQQQTLIDSLNIMCKENGYPPIETCSVGGGADSSHFAVYGIPVLCAFGPRGEHNHTEDEYIIVESLKERTLFLAECIEWCLR